MSSPRPNFKKIYVKTLKITFANCLSLELGSLEVVIMILGSSTPAHLYSSSTWFTIPVVNKRKVEWNGYLFRYS